jgi:hypothetical protein
VNCLDVGDRCPLCDTPFEHDPNASQVSRYPDLDLSPKSYNIVKRIFYFVTIVIVVLSFVLDFWFDDEITWSLISLAVVLYSWTVVYHAIRNNIHIASKIFVQALSGSIFIFFIDRQTGFDGWSVNYIIPQILILANVSIFILMMINRMVLREFLFYQLAMTIIGLIPIFLIFGDVVTRPLASFVSIAISALILLGTVIFGDKTVKSELIRRFHV